MDKNNVITSMTDFMAWVEEALPKAPEPAQQALFYRGHADESYLLEPSVYRTDAAGKSYRNHESQLYLEMLRRDPAAFASDVTIFERLVRMQHHGLPTRLLDLSESPLVALFFACESQPEKNGQVMFFHCKQKMVRHQQALSELALAGVECSLTLLNLWHKVRKDLCQFVESECKLPIGPQETTENHHNFLRGYIANSSFFQGDISEFGVKASLDTYNDFSYMCTILKNFDDAVSSFSAHQSSSKRNAAADAQSALQGFLTRQNNWQVKTIKYLCDQMQIQYRQIWQKLDEFLGGLTDFHFVFPPMNNERLRRQRGAFLLCPPAKTEFWAVTHFQKPEVVTIAAAAKKKLLNELGRQGISRAYLFPELEEQAKDIRTLYPPSAD